MHYKNGREAKNGDKVVLIPEYPKDAQGRLLGTPVVGILYDATAGNDYCNGRIAPILPNDPCPNLKECLHLDDVLAALSAPAPVVTMTAPPVETTHAVPAPLDPPAPAPEPATSPGPAQ